MNKINKMDFNLMGSVFVIFGFFCGCVCNVRKLEILFEVEEEIFDGYVSSKFFIEDFM